MKFMDLLFKRYASPFLLIDNLIINNKFMDFITELIDTVNDEKIYDLWLHRVFDKNYSEFKDEVLSKTVEVEDQDVETTIKNSYEILNNFKPE